MHRVSKPDGLDLSATRTGRSASISSDRPSLSGISAVSPPLNVNPEPLYIAVAAASHLVSSELDIDGATISRGALGLLNSFLDQILFNILARARSTQLNALRPAVIEVLKARLGKEAVTGADEELKEYLGDGEDDESAVFYGGQEPKGDFDLELAWKLARLRCMVYTRLGDLEEDDEEEYIEKENLDDGGRSTRRYSHPSGVTPAAAIFLTSILEYLGEQALYYAGQATQRRIVTAKQDQGEFTALPGIPDKPIIEEIDMFSVGRDSPLSRLWRTWRKNVKSPRGSLSHAISRESLIRRTLSASHNGSRNGSISVPLEENERPIPSVEEVLEEADPSQVPLPLSENDVDEIEVPGLARVIDDEEVQEPTRLDEQAPRPKSMFIVPPALTPPTPITPNDISPSAQQHSQNRPAFKHTRSRSLPTPIQSPFTPAAGEYDESVFVTPMETSDPLEVPTDAQNDDPKTPTQESVSTDKQLQNSNFDSIQTLELKPRTSSMPATHATPQSYSRSNQGVGSEHVPADFLDVDEPEATPKADTFASEAAPAVLSNQVIRQDTAAQDFASTGSPTATGVDDSLRSQHKDAVLAQSPANTSPRSALEAASESTDQHQTKPTKISLDNLPPPASKESGAPRLTPLREMIEEAPDTSDDGLSAAPSNESQNRKTSVASIPDQIKSTHEYVSSPKPINSSIKASKPQILHVKTQAPKAVSESQSAPVIGRATSNRVPASHSVPAMNGVRPQRSDSATERRPETSASQKSVKPQAIYATLDGSRSQGAVAEGKQSLEDLIRSNGTLHYTLTPQNMRDADSFEPQRKPQRTGTSDLAEFLRSTAPPGDSASRPLTSRSAVSAKSTGRRSVQADAHHPPLPSASRSRSGSKSIEIQAVSPSSPRARNIQPRPATIQKDTLRDLADFAKSTGPDSPAQLPTSIKSSSTKTSLDTAHPLGNQSPRPSSQQTATRRTSSVRTNGSRLQARDATVPRDEKSSELIDFIREGPPRDPRDGTHRIPRNVAPFRNTMDSDDLAALGPLKSQDPNGRTSVASTQASSHAPKSVQSSANSRTNLIDNSNKATSKPANNYPSPADRSFGLDEDAEDLMKPKRKQRRVRDPYAIDSDDDEDLEADLQPVPKQKPVRQEESLMDFLRNTSPPPTSKFQAQPLMISENQKAQAIKGLRQHSSSPTLKDRLIRTASNNSHSRSTRAPPGVRFADPSQNTHKPSSAPRTNVARGPTTGLMPARAGVGGTADLTDFLRNSAPPEPFRRMPSPIEEERTGFSRLFSRRKKLVV